MKLPFFINPYNAMQQTAVSRMEGKSVWIEDYAKSPKFFIVYVEGFNCKNEATVQCCFFTYHVDFLFMNCAATHGRWLIEQGHTVIGFPSVKVTSDFLKHCSTVQDQSSVYCVQALRTFTLKRHGGSFD